MKDRLGGTPSWILNLITVGSGIVVALQLISAFLEYINAYITEETTGGFLLNLGESAYITMAVFSIVLFLQVRKYRKLSVDKMKVTAESFSKTALETRNLYFEILAKHKDGRLTLEGLKGEYEKTLEIILDNLCSTMKSFTGQKVSACIKLIEPSKNDGDINTETAEIFTFCRSPNSDANRSEYENNLKAYSEPIFIRDNSDFMDILDNTNDRNYFYQKDLVAYDEAKKKIDSEYRNTNKNWKDYYRSVLVVPIRILKEKIDSKNSKGKADSKNPQNAYNVIGFLCIDSTKTNAFRPIQENFNVNIARAFADTVYILLSQYSHYLDKYGLLTKSN